MSVTHVRTFWMDAWAQTFPKPGQRCAVCDDRLYAEEVAYYVTQLDRDANGDEQPVCAKHVRRLGSKESK